ncbi:MAG: hypothetical protein QNK37_21480 [Acidobacteriota bacterium]|nr:hypothetical protein [Acidobacteriota bacterium]
MTSGFELRIFFTGVCLFAPKAPGDWRVLLADALKPDVCIPGDQTPPKSHAGVIQFQQKNVNPHNTPDRFPIHEDDDHTFWFLDREFVSISAKGCFTPDSLEIDLNTCSFEPYPRTRNQMDNIRYVAPMLGIDSGGNLERARLIDGLLDPIFSNNANELLVGCVRLDKGRLVPCSFGRFEGPNCFDRDGVQQIHANVVQLSVWVDAETVEIASTRFDGTRGKKISLRPEQGKRKYHPPVVEVWVMNLELDQIIELGGEPDQLGVDMYDLEYKLMETLLCNADPHFEATPRVIERFPDGTITQDLQEGRCRDRQMAESYFKIGFSAISAQPCSPSLILPDS